MTLSKEYVSRRPRSQLTASLPQPYHSTFERARIVTDLNRPRIFWSRSTVTVASGCTEDTMLEMHTGTSLGGGGTRLAPRRKPATRDASSWVAGGNGPHIDHRIERETGDSDLRPPHDGVLEMWRFSHQ